MKTEYKNKRDLTPEEQSMIDKGQAVAIELKAPAMSSTVYTVVLATFVALAFLPLWVAPGALMWGVLCFSAAAWLTLYKLATNAAASIFNSSNIQMELSSLLIDMLQKRLDKQEDTDGELSGD